MEQRLHFDTVAALYESSRPEYPSVLFDDLMWLAGIQAGASVLDVGCGTGKSTEPFARRGFHVCALDPGANMLALCQRKLRSYPTIRFVNSAFETWTGGQAEFDLVVSGTAFHWVGEAGYERLLRVLKPHGAVGIFWHTFLRGRDGIHQELDAIYKEHAPHLYVDDLDQVQEMNDRHKEERFVSWPDFGEWRMIRYYSSVRYTAQGYLDLMRTWSNHAGLSDAFFAAVALSIQNAGGEIVKPIRTTLCFGRRIDHTIPRV